MQRTPFKGAVQHYKNMAASNKQHLQGLCLVLQLRSIGVNGAELQNQTQPVDGCGAVFVKKKSSHVFLRLSPHRGRASFWGFRWSFP